MSREIINAVGIACEGPRGTIHAQHAVVGVYNTGERDVSCPMMLRGGQCGAEHGRTCIHLDPQTNHIIVSEGGVTLTDGRPRTSRAGTEPRAGIAQVVDEGR